jgi:hypothetical protein
MPMLIALIARALSKILYFAGMVATIVFIMADRSRHRPENIVPLQLISTIGGWALLLQQVMLVTSIRKGSLIVACAALATLLTTIVSLFAEMDNTSSTVDQLAPKRGEETLAHGVVVAIAHGSHRRPDSRFPTPPVELDRRVLTGLIPDPSDGAPPLATAG